VDAENQNMQLMPRTSSGFLIANLQNLEYEDKLKSCSTKYAELSCFS